VKIIKLTAQNVKRLRVVEITPDGNVVVIGGKNGAGKTSVLDAIQMAIGGKSEACEQPVRQGQKRGEVSLDLGDFVITRSFTEAGGGTLTVKSASGSVSSPQAVLDQLASKLTFDPLAFIRVKPAAQAEALRKLVGIDFTELDTKRAKLYSERTDVGRQVQRLEGAALAMPHHADAPEAPLSAQAITADIQAAVKRNEKIKAEREVVAATARAIAADEAKLETLKVRVHAAEEALKTAEENLRVAKVALNKAAVDADLKKRRWEYDIEKEAVDALQLIDIAPITARMSEVEAVNAKVRSNKLRAERMSEWKSESAKYDDLTSQIEAIDQAKQEMLSKAKFPMAGLAFDANGVSLNGIPFTQLCASEQLKISVAIGIGLNPKLRVMLIRDGSLLDDTSLATVATMAESADMQVWIERVGTGEECSVVIEDGAVAQ
jgi:hypothetical protein